MGVALSLVVPAFNEAGRLALTLRNAAEALPRLADESEIVVVDDGSSDATADVARSQAAAVPVRVVRLARNRGKGAAVAAGVAIARHSLVAFTDADCPYDLEYLRPMLAALTANQTDVAIGARELPDSEINRGYGRLRRISGQSLSILTSVALDLPFRDSQCGLKAFRADVARTLFALRTVDGFGFDFEILTAALRIGFRVQRFPVRLTHNDDSRIAIVRDSLRMAHDLWRVRRQMRAGFYAAPAPGAEAHPCPLCAGDDAEARVARHGYRMVTCRSCGLWYLNPMPTEATLARLYDDGYFASSADRVTGYAAYADMADDARDTFRRRLALVERHVGGGRILDVGAGYGYLADAAARRFPERWMVERSARAAEHADGSTRVVVGTWEEAEVPERYFDVISMQDCLEHFRDPLSALAKTRAALRPGGALLAVTPNVGGWLARLQGWHWVSFKFPEHVVLYSESTLRRALETSGFRIETMVPARQYAHLTFLATRVEAGFPRLGRALAAALRALGGERRVYTPSGSIAVVATVR